MIPLCAPHIAGREAEYVAQALAAGEVGAGTFVTRLEDAIRAYTGARYAVAMSSGTAALHIALLLAGVRPGDEVIVPATTFIATARAVQYCGATPVIVDVERETWGLDPKAALALGRKHIVTVHLYGHPARIPTESTVEDATEALGAKADGASVGSLGLTCLSFNANKLITTGGGGMLLTDDERQANRARQLINQARMLSVETEPPTVTADLLLYGPGFNYRMPNVNAAIGCAQMESIDARLASKRETAEHYQRELPGVFHEQPWARSSYWMPCMLLPPGVDKGAVLRHLAAKGIEARSVWRPLHRQPGLEGCAAGKIEVAEDLYARGVCLPCSVGITHEQRETVIAEVKAALVV